MFFISYLLEYNRYLNILGVFVILAIAILFSRNRSRINYKLLAQALSVHFVIALCMLRTDIGQAVISFVVRGINNLYQFAEVGTEFVFGNLTHADGPWGFIFAVKVLPIVIFFGALLSVLFYYGIIQRVVTGLNYIIQPLLGTSGQETACAIANSLLGQAEACQLVRNYIKNMTNSEVFVIMVSGMGTISASLLAVYSVMGVPARHLLSSNVMAIPATILIAKIIYPETGKNEEGEAALELAPLPVANAFDAVLRGAYDGLAIAINIGAMLIAFLALLSMVNAILGLVGVTLQGTLGLLFAPFGWLLGLTGKEIGIAGELIGIKVAVNELVAFTALLASGLSERSTALLTYALCGFSNFSCIGLQVGCLGALAPTKRRMLTELGLYAMLGGMLSNLLSAMVAGLLL